MFSIRHASTARRCSRGRDGSNSRDARNGRWSRPSFWTYLKLYYVSVRMSNPAPRVDPMGRPERRLNGIAGKRCTGKLNLARNALCLEGSYWFFSRWGRAPTSVAARRKICTAGFNNPGFPSCKSPPRDGRKWCDRTAHELRELPLRNGRSCGSNACERCSPGGDPAGRAAPP